MGMEIREDLFDGIIDSFRYHLDLQDNHRVLFSGRFGIGKTTFLHHYFNNDERYNVIYLYPVNYSVLENEDIFSYVKYDILVSLLANYDYPTKADYHDELAKWPKFLTDNLDQVIATAMLLIPKMGKQLNQFVKELSVLKGAFDKVNKSKKDRELDELSDFLTQFHQAEGGIYESNVVTLIIQEWLKQLIEDDKRNILIIDDLDRIDPNHIFRLLNVFSAHFDSRAPGDAHNKFGFDQVLMVCDAANIENIFRAQYGIESDFNGYIDKFYSKEIYRFDNDQNILKIIENILDHVQLLWAPHGETTEHSSGADLKNFIRPLLEELVLSRKVNLRSLLKFYDRSLLLPDVSYRIKSISVNINESYLLSAVYILSQFIGDLQLLIDKINLMPHIYLEHSDNPHLFLAELVSLHHRKHVKRNHILHSFHQNEIPIEMTIMAIDYSGSFSIHRPSSNKWTLPFASLDQLILNDEVIYDRNEKELERYDISELLRETLKLIA